MLTLFAQAAQAQPNALSQFPLAVLVPMIGLPAFWIAAFIFFVIKCAIFGMERSPRIDQLTKTPWLPRIVMEFAYWMFRIPVRICIALHITPNMITFGSLLLTVLGAVLVGIGQFALGGWTLLFAFTCDALDGIVARATNQTTASGEFFDSTIDRYNDLIAFLGYLYYYRDNLLAFVLCATALVGSTVVSYSRAKGDAVGINANVGYMQRHERGTYLGIATILAPILSAYMEPANRQPSYPLVILILGVLAVMTHVTALMRISVVMKGLKERAVKSPSAAA